jgi:ElaB/YqjD/DUF883 family membrane-anchored ribosome-binding protein
MSKPTTNFPEDLGEQIAALRADLVKLAETVSSDVSDGIGSAGRQISQSGRDARDSATATVLDHPLAAVGIAAGLGLLVGLVARKA